MKRIKVGHLDVALLDHNNRRVPWTLLIDWRMPEPGNRWRLSVGPRLWIPFSERELGIGRARRRRILGLDFAWYGRGTE
jgi:hypothetical protein